MGLVLSENIVIQTGLKSCIRELVSSTLKHEKYSILATHSLLVRTPSPFALSFIFYIFEIKKNKSDANDEVCRILLKISSFQDMFKACQIHVRYLLETLFVSTFVWGQNIFGVKILRGSK